MAVIAIDFGGTRIKLGLIDQGLTRVMRVIEAESRAGLATRLPAIHEAIHSAAAEARVGLKECPGLAWPCPA